MSTETQELMEMGSKPVNEHEWLQQLVGEWRTESEMTMPDGQTIAAHGHESVKSLGGLWAFGEGHTTMPNGAPMEYYTGLGWDLTFKGYRGFNVMSVSSHLWKYEGTLSADGKTMTLNCEGPNMEKDGETAMYRDVIEIIDRDHRTLTTYGQDDSGQWMLFMKAHYTRA